MGDRSVPTRHGRPRRVRCPQREPRHLSAAIAEEGLAPPRIGDRPAAQRPAESRRGRTATRADPSPEAERGFVGRATELVRLPVDVIVTPPDTVCAYRETSYQDGSDRCRAGDCSRQGSLVTSLARPGGNVTGTTCLGPEVLTKAKGFELLRESRSSGSCALQSSSIQLTQLKRRTTTRSRRWPDLFASDFIVSAYEIRWTSPAPPRLSSACARTRSWGTRCP